MRIARCWPACLAALLLAATGCLVACTRGGTQTAGGSAPQPVVDLFIWADDIAPDTLAAFEQQTGIKVRLSFFDSPEALESRMLTGSSGYDVAVPTAAFVRRQIRSGAYLALDKTKLPNIGNLDPALMARVANNDPGNAHGIIYTWGTFGIGINRMAVQNRLPRGEVPPTWGLVFDPALASQVAACGISIMDDPVGVLRLALIYLRRNPNDPTEQDYADAGALLGKIRPYVRNIDTSGQIQALANGELCVAVAYNGNVVQASRRAAETHSAVQIDYLIPSEGTLLWFDLMAIPRDAPHAENAYRFLDFLMRPEVIAHITTVIGYANANAAATPLLDSAIAADAAIYPRPDQQRGLVTQVEPTPEQTRAFTRVWQRFKTGQ